MKKTGSWWANFLRVNINTPKGWANDKEFKTLKITREEFLNRASSSEIVSSSPISRRDAAKLLKKITPHKFKL